MTIVATYIDASHFSIPGEHDQELPTGRSLLLNQAGSGTVETKVVTATFDSEDVKTIIQVNPAVVTASITTFQRGATSPNSGAAHYHTSLSDQGFLPASLISQANVEKLVAILSLAFSEGDCLQGDAAGDLVAGPPVEIHPLTAGEALEQYEVVYQDAADAGKAKLATCSGTVEEADAVALVYVSAIEEDTSGNCLFDGPVENDAWSWTPGAILYVGATPGTMVEDRPATNPVRCARAITDKKIRFHNPFFDVLGYTT